MHTWEVLSRLKDLARLKPWLPTLTDIPSLWHILYWSAFFHDWGKTAQGFQEMIRGKGNWGHRHEILSLVFLEWVQQVLTEEERIAVIATILSHHKDADFIFSDYPLRMNPENDPVNQLVLQLCDEDIRRLHRWLFELGNDWIEKLEFHHLGVRFPEQIPSEDVAVEQIINHGAEIIRKQLRDYRKFTEQLREEDLPGWIVPGIILRGTMIQSDHMGSAHIDPLPALTIQMDSILNVFNKDIRLYQHQENAGVTLGSAILVAPTGSGKTAAALIWAGAQMRETTVSKLFYTLPYQASMNAMFRRLEEIFPGAVGLLHGRSLLALYHQLMNMRYTPEQASKIAKRLRNLVRLHYFPIQICSPYQMLKAAFQLKAYEVLLSDFAGAAFIFDEIHAYDPKRLALILELTKFLRQKLGSRFFIMTATLPTHIQRRLEEALGNPTIIRSGESLFKNFIRHKVELIEGDLLAEENLRRIESAFKEGKSVLVTCNTIKRAKLAYVALNKVLPNGSVLLIHSRFNGRDRLAKEQEIIKYVGLKSGERKNKVVISTQVVEVSLNIDLDVLFTDPAPLEALIQRFGRINRSRRLPIAPVYVFKEPADGQGVYLPQLVKKAVKVLDQYANGRELDEESVTDWLNEVYQDEILEIWEKEYTKTANEFRISFIEKLVPFSSDEFLAQSFEKLFDGIEVLPISLEEEFGKCREVNTLEATQLLVPISWKKFSHFVKKKKVLSPPDKWPPIVDVDYSSEMGLLNEE